MMSETNNSKSGVVTLILGVITVALGITSVFLSAYLVTETKSSVKNVDLEKKKKIECNVLIIGSGFAGSYAAYQLAPRHNGTLCLVERLDRDGGRVHDISEYPNGPVFGTGALRITNRQATMKTLADELGVEFELADSDVELLKV
jgi:ribulose 1,5-bisphosphate synthetase/thiazole synthase